MSWYRQCACASPHTCGERLDLLHATELREFLTLQKLLLPASKYLVLLPFQPQVKENSPPWSISPRGPEYEDNQVKMVSSEWTNTLTDKLTVSKLRKLGCIANRRLTQNILVFVSFTYCFRDVNLALFCSMIRLKLKWIQRPTHWPTPRWPKLSWTWCSKLLTTNSWGRGLMKVRKWTY